MTTANDPLYRFTTPQGRTYRTVTIREEVNGRFRMFACQECGGWVNDTEAHDRWHLWNQPPGPIG